MCAFPYRKGFYYGRNGGGGQGAQFPGRWTTMGAPNHSGGAKWLQRVPLSPNNFTSTFFNTVHFLPKDLRCEYGTAKLASCHGRQITSLRPWILRLDVRSWVPGEQARSQVLSFFWGKYILGCKTFVLKLNLKKRRCCDASCDRFCNSFTNR